MQKRVLLWGVLILLTSASFLFSARADRQNSLLETDATENRTDADKLVVDAALATDGMRFLQQRMQSPDGLIYYSVEHKAPASYSVLESMGQVMEYAALVGDQELLENAAAGVEKYFRAPEGYYYWKINTDDKSGETSSALVDDLRLAKAYGIANQANPGRYDPEIKKLADVILKFDVDANGYPCDYYDGEGKITADDVSLFYLDVKTMDLLGRYNSKWLVPSQKAKEILLNIPDNKYGFYPKAFNVRTKKYVVEDTVNMVENLYTALDAEDAGKNTRNFAVFLKKQMKKGKIYNHYKLNGAPSVDDESTAVYALAVRFLMRHHETEAAAQCYRRLVDFQIQAPDQFAGGFGDADGGLVYAFDQLETLLMLQTMGAANVGQ